MGHHLGEVNITWACRCIGLLQMASTNLKCSMLNLHRPKFFQSYKNKNNNTALARVRHVEELGHKAILSFD